MTASADQSGAATPAQIVLDIALRILSCLCVGYFAWMAIAAYHLDPSRKTLIVAVVSEVTTIVISLISRRPANRDWRAATVAATLYASCLYPLLISVEPGLRFLSETTCTILQVTGMVWAIASKLALGKSFGWLPANRGIVSEGPYRLVRHPIYLGYLAMHIGFLSANFNLQNALIYLVLYLVQVFRILKEEELLMQDEQYRAYARKVRYRLIAGIF